MFDSGVLDTAIGLIFVFLLVSMLVTIANEIISAVLLSRAKWLRRGVDRLLGSQRAKELYEHPLIGGTSTLQSDASTPGEELYRGRGPSYIASRSFASVLLDLVRRDAPTIKLLKTTLQGALDRANASSTTLEQLKTSVANAKLGIGADMIRSDLARVIERFKDGYAVAEARADIQRFIDGMPSRYLRVTIEKMADDDRLKKTLLVLLDDAGGDIARFQQNIEIWFNNAMERVGGWYKRRSQWVIAGLSLLAAVCLNVDAILIVKYLDTNRGVRDALVAQAQAFAASAPPIVKASPEPAGAMRAMSGERFEGVLTFEVPASAAGVVTFTSNHAGVTLRAASAPVPANAASAAFGFTSKPSTRASQVAIHASGAASGVATVQLDPHLGQQFNAIEQRLLDLNLPIGWVRKATQGELEYRQLVPWEKPAEWIDTIRFHLLGWLLTALAATLGAPFWFDTLNRVISIRSSGKAPEERQKPPKDVPTPLEPGQSPSEADRLDAIKGQ